MDSVGDWVGAIAGLLGAVVAIVTALSSARKNEVEILRAIIEELDKRLEDARGRIQSLEEQVAEWKRRYFELCAWVRQHGLQPPSTDE